MPVGDPPRVTPERAVKLTASWAKGSGAPVDLAARAILAEVRLDPEDARELQILGLAALAASLRVVEDAMGPMNGGGERCERKRSRRLLPQGSSTVILPGFLTLNSDAPDSCQAVTFTLSAVKVEATV